MQIIYVKTEIMFIIIMMRVVIHIGLKFESVKLFALDMHIFRHLMRMRTDSKSMALICFA